MVALRRVLFVACRLMIGVLFVVCWLVLSLGVRCLMFGVERCVMCRVLLNVYCSVVY